MPSLPSSLFWPSAPAAATPAPGAATSAACSLPNLYPGGFQPAAGNWQIYVNTSACKFCLWDTNEPIAFPGGSDWQTYGIQYASGAGGTVQDLNSLYRTLFGNAGWSENCPTSPAPAPVPTPVSASPPTTAPPSGAPGSSCDNPLFITTCPAPQTTQPPTPPPTSQPPTAPPAPAPPVGQAGAPCITDTLADLTAWVDSLPAAPSGAVSGPVCGAVGQLPFVGSALNGICQGLAGFGEQWIGAASLCSAASVPMAARYAVGFIDKWTGPLPEIIRGLTYAINVACPSMLPSLADANAASLANVINDTEWQYWVNANGLCTDHASKLRFAERRKPEYLDLLRLWLRGNLTEPGVNDRLRNLGWLDTTERDLIKQFAKELPNPSDLVRFAVRHVFEPDLAQAFGFSDELNQQFVDWHAKLGFGYDVPITDPQSGKQYNINWAIAQWWSHWVWPSPQQAVQAGQRFRPGRDTSEEDEDTARIEVDQGTVSLLLRGNDYPPQFRSIIQALGRPLPGLRQLSQTLQAGAIDRAAVLEVFRKLGYSTFWAEAQADGVIHLADKQLASQVKAAAGGPIEAAWEAGAIEDQAYLNYLTESGLGIDQAAEVLALAKVKRLTARIKARVRIFRSGFLRGTWNRADVENFLTQEGMTMEVVLAHVQDWELELQPKRRELSRGDLKRSACDGLIDLPTLVSRLQNLGYSNDDIGITLGEVQLCVAQKSARLLSQQDQLFSKSQKQAQQAVKQAAALLRQQQANLAKHGSSRDLAKWYWEGTIPLDEVYGRLSFLGWPDPDIERLLIDSRPSELKATQQARKEMALHGSPTELAKWFTEGTIQFPEFVSRLRVLQWPDADIARLIVEHGGTVPVGFPG